MRISVPLFALIAGLTSIVQAQTPIDTKDLQNIDDYRSKAYLTQPIIKADKERTNYAKYEAQLRRTSEWKDQLPKDVASKLADYLIALKELAALQHQAAVKSIERSEAHQHGKPDDLLRAQLQGLVQKANTLKATTVKPAQRRFLEAVQAEYKDDAIKLEMIERGLKADPVGAFTTAGLIDLLLQEEALAHHTPELRDRIRADLETKIPDQPKAITVTALHGYDRQLSGPSSDKKDIEVKDQNAKEIVEEIFKFTERFKDLRVVGVQVQHSEPAGSQTILNYEVSTGLKFEDGQPIDLLTPKP